MWVLILLVALPSANAQVKTKPLEYHLYGGLNALYITEEAPIYEMHYGLGWLVGANVRYGKRAFVQTGLELANQQVTMAARSAESTVVSNAKLGLRSIQVPLMAGLKLLKSNNDFFDVYVAVGGKLTFINPNNNSFALQAKNFSQPLVTPTFTFGVEVWRVTAGLNYQYGGLSPVFRNYAQDAQMHTATISIGGRF